MSDIKQRLSRLSPAKRALLERKLLTGSKTRASSIPVCPDDERHLLSPAELRLWFVDQLEPNDPFYNMPLAARISGPLDHQALSESLRMLVQRHESLRSTYTNFDGVPKRVVHSTSETFLKVVDLTAPYQPNDVQPHEVLTSQLRHFSRQTFSLEHGPLLRCVVFKLDELEHCVLLVMHHIVSDGWSMVVMLQELAGLYQSQRTGMAVNLPELEIQVSDFAHWQRQQLEGKRIEQQLDYWRGQLAGAPLVLDLPTDYPRPAVQDFQGATCPFELSPATSSAVAKLAQQEDATSFMVVLAAYSILLARIARQADLIIGTAVAGRDHPQLESLIGFFVKTLALRFQTGDNPTFLEHLRAVRNTVLDAFANQDVPFEKLVEELASERDRSYSPLFQCAMVMQNVPREFPTAPGNTLIPMHVDNGTAKYDFTLFFWEDNGRLIGHAEYRSALFAECTVIRLLDSFQTLLVSALADPSLAVNDLPMLSAGQRELVLTQWNATECPLPEPQLLHELVSVWARQTPTATAIRHGERIINYVELDNLANEVARRIMRAGGRYQSPVVVLLPRSIESIAISLGILKAGCIYVPLDPGLPLQRVQNILKDTAAHLVVADVELPTLDSSTTVQIGSDQLCRSVEGQSKVDDVHLPQVQPQDLAYIIFTSGSTGAAKGVQVEHRSIVNFLRAQGATMGVGSHDRVSHCLSPSFDGSLSERFLGLGHGACVVVIDQEQLLDPRAFTEVLHSQGVTVGKFPPALLATLNSDELPELKTVASAGEKLTKELAERWLDGRRFFNGYGPTEATVGVSMAELQRPLNFRPPIGKPMANMKIYILDPRQQPMPVGVPGEIVIGGMGVARGYLNRLELSSEKFLSDPFSSEPHARMYRTGDLGKWNADGEIEFLGRVDDQVKLRGFRIEPGEIAATIETQLGVRQAIVLARDVEGTGTQLIAYVVMDKSVDCADDERLQLEQEHVSGWRNLFEQAHRHSGPVINPEFNIVGWISTFTGKPIPPLEMREWADAAAARIRSMSPKRILEIGCGTGLILLRVAPICERYVGTDMLPSSLDNVRRTLEHRPDLQSRVDLFECAGDNLDCVGGEKFDCIVLNSVVQYFPSVEYLLRVLKRAVAQLSPGGKIFLGDLRNSRLQHAMATAVELFQAEDGLSVDEFRRRVAARIDHDAELLVDPKLFDSLQEQLGRPFRCETQIKATTADNELSNFRYDVILHFDEASIAADRELDAQEARNGLSVDSVRSILEDAKPQHLVVRHLRNSRVANDVRRSWHLRHRPVASLSELRRLDASQLHAMDPNIFRELALELPYDIAIAWDPMQSDCCEVHFHQRGLKGTCNSSISQVGTRAIEGQLIQSDPLASRYQQRISKRLRDALKAQLPQYMVPSAFLVIDEIPLTMQGKVDRGLLPAPPLRPLASGEVILPADEAEQLVASVWEDLLDVHPIGATDNFFELGGHSMLAVRMTAEIERRSGYAIPLAALFEEPTVRYLASLLRNPASRGAKGSLIALGGQSSEGTPLFCIHPAGGTVFCYRPLAERLGSERPIFGLQAVGIDGKDTPHFSLDEMASHYVSAIRAARPQGPYHIAGWSLGGNIAFEVARQLQQTGEPIGVLALFDSGLLSAETTLNEEDFLPMIMALFPGDEHISLEELRQKSREEQVRYFTGRAAQAGIVPAEHEEMGKHIMQVFQANVKAVHEYRPLPFAGTVTLFRPTEQSKTNSLFDDPRLGWQPHCQEVVIEHVPGDHARMLKHPTVEQLANRLQEICRVADYRMLTSQT